MGLIIKIYLGEYMSVNEISHELSVETINYVHDISTLKQLLLNGASINFQNKIGWSALFEAVTFGHAVTLKELITMGVNINMIDSKGRNALFWALFHNQTQCAKDLISYGINLTNDVSPLLPAIHYATYKQN